MTPAEQYRQLASQALARGQSMQSISEDRDWQYLARLYLQLAKQAERNARKDALTIRFCANPGH
jgi:hypothetical protein